MAVAPPRPAGASMRARCRRRAPAHRARGGGRRGDPPGVAQAAAAEALAARDAAEDEHFAGEEAGTGRQLDRRRAIEPAAVEEDRLLRHPFEPGVRCQPQRYVDAAVGAERAIDLFRRLGGDERPRIFASARPSPGSRPRRPCRRRWSAAPPSSRPSPVRAETAPARAPSDANRRDGCLADAPANDSATIPSIRFARSHREMAAHLGLDHGIAAARPRRLRPGRGPHSVSARSRANSKYCSTSRIAMAPRATRWRITRSMSLMIEGWMPSVGSSRTSSFGLVTSARAMASCCCWPPERSPPRRPSMSRSTGNSSKISSGTWRSGRATAAKPVSRFSSTVSKRKDLPALRHVGDAARRPLMGGERRDVFALEADATAADRVLADDGPQQARLADAVAAEDARDGVRLGLQADALEDLARPVEQIDPVDLQHRLSARDRLR